MKAMSTTTRVSVPRDRENDYTNQAAETRRDLVPEPTRVDLANVGSYSIDPSILTGNVEQFLGVAQVPIGLAGPLLVRLLHESGGVTTTIIEDHMQRAPAFLFASAREARDFAGWLDEHFDEIKAQAESTTRSGKLQDIERYSAGRILYTRFNYTTGDAAGQNLTGKATQAACRWIVEHHPEIERYFLESNFATDKKSSQVNMLNTRGKRVIAEAV